MLGQHTAVMVLFCAIVLMASPLLWQTQIVGLRPELAWQRTSPTAQRPDGSLLHPIVYCSNSMHDTSPKPMASVTKVNPGTTTNGRVLNSIGTGGATSWCQDFIGTSEHNTVQPGGKLLREES